MMERRWRRGDGEDMIESGWGGDDGGETMERGVESEERGVEGE